MPAIGWLGRATLRPGKIILKHILPPKRGKELMPLRPRLPSDYQEGIYKRPLGKVLAEERKEGGWIVPKKHVEQKEMGVQSWLQDLIPKKEAVRKRESLRESIGSSILPTPKKLERVPSVEPTPFRKGILKEAGPGRGKERYESRLSRWEAALANAKEKQKMLEDIIATGGVEETRLVPIDERLGRTWDETRRINVTLKEAVALYESDPSKFKFASTPTGGPPVHQLSFNKGEVPSYEKYNIKSLVPELKREEAKMRGVPTPTQKTVLRKKRLDLATPEGSAWANIIAEAPREAGFWRSVKESQPGGAAGVKRKESTRGFFTRMFKEYRMDKFKFAKKRRAEPMIRKFQTYEKMGLLKGVGAVSIMDYIGGE